MDRGIEPLLHHPDDLEPIFAIHWATGRDDEVVGVVEQAGTECERQPVLRLIGMFLGTVELNLHGAPICKLHSLSRRFFNCMSRLRTDGGQIP